ncbi:MAG TPA: hypothetical protein DCY41_08300 [Opitutae bacterium]|nr:hypothetical protein [Opitutae bacterium]
MPALTPEQRQKVTRWVADGASLSEVQQRLQSELNLSMTYMDVRFLVDDLDLTLVEKIEPKVEAPVAAGSEVIAPATEAVPSPAGKVSVSVDSIAHPGYSVTGQVTFSDGQTAKWFVDMEGRPGLQATTPGYRPTPADIQEFQVLLDAEFRKLGY